MIPEACLNDVGCMFALTFTGSMLLFLIFIHTVGREEQ